MSIHSRLPFNQPEIQPDFKGSHTHYRTCTLCEAMCGIEIKTENQQIISIKGDANDPFSRGYICPKATALQDLHEDPERIRHPMKRTASGWQKISWDEALNTTAESLKNIQKQHGKNAVATYLGNPNAHNLGSMLFGIQFLKMLKTKNKFSATSVDQIPHHIVCYQLFGHFLYIPIPDLDRTDFFLMIGSNPLASHGSLMTAPDIKNRLKAIRARGGKIVLIDPRKTETAEYADRHHFIQPATDALLLLGLLHTLYDENLIDRKKIPSYVANTENIPQYLTAYAPERVSAATGIAAADIRQLARDFAAAKTAVCYGRMGASVQQFGTLTQYLITLLNIVTGRLDTVGGAMFPTPAANIMPLAGRGHIGRYHSRVRGLPEFAGELPVNCLAEEISTAGEGQIKALVVAAGNPVLSTPNSDQLDQALSQLDFMVSIDFYLNETNRHAHIILPPVGPLERDHYDLVFHGLAIRNTAKWSNALFAPQGEARQDWQIYVDLATRMQSKPRLYHRFIQTTVEQLGPIAIVDGLLRTGIYGGKLKINQGLSVAKLKANPHGIDLGALKPQLPKGLWHKNNLVDLKLDYFMADLARLEQHFFAEKTTNSAYPLLLIGRRHVRSNNSWLHNSHRLVKGKNRCTAMIHPQDAEKLGILHQQQVTIRSRVGEITLAAEVTDAIMQGVVSVPHGWGHNKAGTQWAIAEQHAGQNTNVLTDEMVVDVMSGNSVLNGVPVSVALAEVG